MVLTYRDTDWSIPCKGEGDKEKCDICWSAGDGGSVGPYCADFEYKIFRAPLVIEQGREWLSWCGEWRFGPFPRDYQERICRWKDEWEVKLYQAYSDK